MNRAVVTIMVPEVVCFRSATVESRIAPCATQRRIAVALALTALLSMSATAFAQQPPCVDTDNDGYGNPGSTSCRNGAATDCNNTDAAINPGATEICNGVDDNCNQQVDEGFDVDGDGFTSCNGDCNDIERLINPRANERCNGIDDDCDQQIDEGFVANVRDGDQESDTFNQFIDLPLGAACIDGLGICTAFGIVGCNTAGSAAVCVAQLGAPQQEGPVGHPSCYDRIDNDCDGLVDHGNPTIPDHEGDTPCTEPEKCNTFDDDNDGDVDEDFVLGGECEAGTGLCRKTGRIVCSPTGGTICDAIPLAPGVEGPAGGTRCNDGLDNDCDRLIDFEDSNCREAERCDGRDNDGNDEVDETFTDLGQPCAAGLGPCRRSGIRICSGDGRGTVCNAVPLKGEPEGPRGITCRDQIDNDCDGFVDFKDPNCSGVGLAASCTLTPGICRDCVGWYTIDFSSSDPEAIVTAELLAVDLNGEIVTRLPVQRGDTANLGALTYPTDCIVAQTIENRHQVFAPVPMLRVTAENGSGKDTAYCTNTPYVEVVEPSGQVVSGSEGDNTPVLAAIPLVNPATLAVVVDGVNILPAMGVDPATAFPGGPYDGSASVNGRIVQVTDLLVRTAPLGSPTANTLSMTLTNLGCGGHIIRVTGSELPGSLDHPVYEECYLDDLLDKGTSEGFIVEITVPAENSVVGNHPSSVNVRGEVCHGRAIASAAINRFPVSVAGQTSVLGDGENSGDKYTLPINVNVPVTNLRNVVDTGATAGSFDPGPNRLVAQAIDGDFNTTYDSVFFAVGPVIPTPTTTVTAGGPGEVVHAFNLAITTAGMNTFFESLKERNKNDIGGRVRDRIKQFSKGFRPDISDSCDPWTTSTIPTAEYQNNVFSIKVDPQQNVIHVRINLPGIDKNVHLDGYCETDCICAFGGCACFVCTDIDIDYLFKRTGMAVTFDVTEDRLLNRTPLDIGFVEGDVDNGLHLRGEVDIGCVVGFFLDVVDFIVYIFTFGLVELDLDIITLDIDSNDLKDRFGGLDGDPFDLDLVKARNPDLSNFGARQRDSRISDAQITTQGIAVSLASAFEAEPSEVDAAAPSIPGTPLKNAPLPQPPIRDAAGNLAGHVTLALSDDLFNQLFNTAVQTGRLRTEFTVVRELRDFLPDDCDEITDQDKRARCIGMQGGDDCDRFCARFDGCDDVCEQEFPYPGSFQEDQSRRQCCRARRIDFNRNIGGGTTLILHGRMNVPPRMLIDDDPATAPVEVILRSPQVSIYLIADRDSDGTLDAGELETIPACEFGNLDNESPTESVDATQCKLWETCLQADFRFQLFLEAGANGRPRIRFGNGEIIRHDEAFGSLCGGSIDVPELDFFNDRAARTEIFDILDERQRDNTPPLDGEGLELGGFVSFQRDRLIAIETQAPAQNDGFQDYIGVTGNIVPTP